MKYKILFVCLGNICRSPAAEALFIDQLKKKNLIDQFEIDSAGTSSAHAGELADSRMRAAAKRRGIDITSRSRPITAADLTYFDKIVVMDDSNLNNVLMLATDNQQRSKIVKMTDFAQEFSSDFVPDPYYGGDQGFEMVLNLLTDCASGLLKACKSELT
jgi:protein-tyrosine phosphatase